MEKYRVRFYGTWEAILKLWGKINIGLWIALGIEITCLILWFAKLIPWWAWALSIAIWCVIFAMSSIIGFCVRYFEKEIEAGKYQN